MKESHNLHYLAFYLIEIKKNILQLIVQLSY